MKERRSPIDRNQQDRLRAIGPSASNDLVLQTTCSEKEACLPVQALACRAKTIALHDLAATASTSRPHCRSAVHDMRRWVKRLHAEANKCMLVKAHGRLGVKSVSMAFNPEPHAGPLRDVAWLRDAACPFSSMTCSPLTCQNPGRCLAQYPPCAIPPKPPAAHDMSSNPSPNPPNPARAVVS